MRKKIGRHKSPGKQTKYFFVPRRPASSKSQSPLTLQDLTTERTSCHPLPFALRSDIRLDVFRSDGFLMRNRGSISQSETQIVCSGRPIANRVRPFDQRPNSRAFPKVLPARVPINSSSLANAIRDRDDAASEGIGDRPKSQSPLQS